jgi:hypothetical protein
MSHKIHSSIMAILGKVINEFLIIIRGVYFASKIPLIKITSVQLPLFNTWHNARFSDRADFLNSMI